MTRQLRLLLTAAAVTAATVHLPAANWPQWRGLDGQGISDEKNVPAEWSPTRNVAWKTALPGYGQSQPIVWGSRVFLTADVEGRAGPHRPQGARAHDGRPAVGAPRQRGHRQAPHDEGAGAGPGQRRRSLGTHRLRGHRVRPPAPPRQLRRADHGDRRRDGGGLLRAGGPVRLRHRRQSQVEGRRRQVPAARHGHRHLAGPVREPRDHPARRERREAVAAAGLRHQDRQGGLAHALARWKPAGPRRSS